MTKKILFVTPNADMGGSERVILDLIQGLDRARFEPMLACFKPGDLVEQARAGGAKTFTLTTHKAREAHKVTRVIGDLRAVVQRENVDIVHANQGSLLLYGALAARARPGTKCVWHVHDPLGDRTAFERVFVTLQKRLRPGWTIYANPVVAASYAPVYPHIGANSSVILPGTNTRTLSEDADPNRTRDKFAVPAFAPVVSVFARLQSSKGHLDLVAAAPRVLAAFPETRFLLCGGTLAGIEPEYAGQVQQAIDDAGFADRVTMTGFVSDADKRDILAATTVLCHPATWEPFGIAVIEGMAAGKPVVVADSEGPSTIVVPGETGLIVPKRDPAALAAALIALLSDPDLARRMGQAGHTRVAENYTTEAMVRQVERVYAGLGKGMAP